MRKTIISCDVCGHEVDGENAVMGVSLEVYKFQSCWSICKKDVCIKCRESIIKGIECLVESLEDKEKKESQ